MSAAADACQEPPWEPVRGESPIVRRLRVPGGWLYQVENPVAYWCAPTFVPDPQHGAPAPTTPTLCTVDDGVPVPKSEDFWRGFIRGLTDLNTRVRLASARHHIDGGLVAGVIDELIHRPVTWLTSRESPGRGSSG